MYINDIIWIPDIVEKLAWKHGIIPEEIDEVLFGKPFFRKVQKGLTPGEDVFAALGQTDAGRYLIVIFVYKKTRDAVVISARDMNRKERRQYARR